MLHLNSIRIALHIYEVKTVEINHLNPEWTAQLLDSGLVQRTDDGARVSMTSSGLIWIKENILAIPAPNPAIGFGEYRAALTEFRRRCNDAITEPSTENALNFLAKVNADVHGVSKIERGQAGDIGELDRAAAGVKLRKTFDSPGVTVSEEVQEIVGTLEACSCQTEKPAPTIKLGGQLTFEAHEAIGETRVVRKATIEMHPHATLEHLRAALAIMQGVLAADHADPV